MKSLLRAVAVLAVLFLGLFQQGAVVADRPYTSVLTVTNGQRWGTWRWPEMCPDQYFAIGFSTRVESRQGDGDDTAMNGIRLICGKDEDQSSTYTVESHPGFWGDWSSPQYCPSGVLTSFQLRVEGNQGRGDDTTANNIRFRCSSNPVLEGKGLDWGEYGGWSQDCVNGGICGIETRMEDQQGGGDDTALNDVRFRCCDRTLQVEPKQGGGDDTAMNGIRLICGKDGDRTHIVESHPGFWGEWSNPQYCPGGVLTCFQLRVATLQGNDDDTAVNNIKFRCSNGHELEGSGLDWGGYGQWSQDCVNGGICGIETKVEELQGEEDDTALNDVRFRCCARAQK